MDDTITIGRLALDGMLLASLISIAIGVLVLQLWVRSDPANRSGPWAELLLTGTLVGLLGWKLGIALRDPALMLQPMKLLIVRGGIIEVWAGFVLAAWYIAYAAWRRGIKLMLLFSVMAFAAMPALAAWNLLTGWPYRLGYAAVFIVMAFVVMRPAQGQPLASTGLLRAVLLGSGIGCLIVSLVIVPPGAGAYLWLGLQPVQWLFIGSALAAMLCPEAEPHGSRQEEPEAAE